MSDQLRRVDLTLDMARPEVVRRSDGGQTVRVEGFGTETEPGAPTLPLLVCQVELPEAAQVLGLDIVDDDAVALDGQFRIAAAEPVVEDEPVDERRRAWARDRAHRVWARTHEKVYRADRWYPSCAVRLRPSRSARSCVIVPLQLTPVQLNPVQRRLRWTPVVRAVLRYSLPSSAAAAHPDVAVTTPAQPRINPYAPWLRQAPVPLPHEEEAYNYLVIVPDARIQRAMRRFVAWKQSIGHRVRVVRLQDVLSTAAGVDDAARVRRFLVDRYRAWGLHYVLLVGAMGTIPTRLLYMDDRTDAYASDFYFANLHSLDWDLDHDDRWGEFVADRYSPAHDVVVGRLPLDSAADVEQYCDNLVAFEQDTGAWKRSALFAAGFMDHLPTDGAELCEALKADVLGPAGWTSRTLYEHGGTFPSRYASDDDLDQPHYAAECTSRPHALVTLVAHGNWDGMESKQCTDPGRKCTDATVVGNSFGLAGGIAAACPTAVVSMIGCSTACPVDSYKHVETQEGQPPVSPQRSLFPFTAHHEHNGVRYLRSGAVAAIGASAGTDYAHRWNDPADGQSWSAAYYIHDRLITHRKPVGDAFFEGMDLYAGRHHPRRGVRDLYLMGDPSLIIEGIVPATLDGADVLVHSGRWSHYAATYDRGGELYVVVSIGASAEPAELLVYTSHDHGTTWTLWRHVEGVPAALSLDAVVNHGIAGESPRDDLLVFTTGLDGNIRRHVFPLSGGAHTVTTVPTAGQVANVLSVAHDALEPGSRLYLGYWYYDPHGETQAIVGVSDDNGSSWRDWQRFPGYHCPTLDAGPDDHVYVAAISDNHTGDVCVARSPDGGRTWGSWTNLTRLDGANDHYWRGPPSVAASTDPGHPRVWVAYERRHHGAYGPSRTELGYACSEDHGRSWTRNLTLAAGPGDVEQVHLAGYKPAPNPWINSAHVSSQPAGPQASRARIMRRAVSATRPRQWQAAAVLNHVAAHDERPQLVYSPGAAGTGGGIVFAGPSGVLFSAPWLTR
jgi:hypothetical protein